MSSSSTCSYCPLNFTFDRSAVDQSCIAYCIVFKKGKTLEKTRLAYWCQTTRARIATRFFMPLPVQWLFCFVRILPNWQAQLRGYFVLCVFTCPARLITRRILTLFGRLHCLMRCRLASSFNCITPFFNCLNLTILAPRVCHRVSRSSALLTLFKSHIGSFCLHSSQLPS